MAHHKHHYRRRHNPFSAGNIAPLATKVAGGLAGGIGAAVIPGALGPQLSTGWAGVAAALIVAFGGSYITKGMSANFSEGVLIGGTLQAAGRISQIVLKKNLVSFSLGAYGPMAFPVPTPSYAQPQIPASAGVTKGGGVVTMGYHRAGAGYRGVSKWAA